MGLYRLPNVEVYWQTNGLAPLHPTITNTISRVRYQQLHRFLHISDPIDQSETEAYDTYRRRKPLRKWYYRILPIAADLKVNWQRYRTPGSHLAIDESMIRETGL